MRNSKWEFPHPLLTEGRDDYTSGTFQIEEHEHKEVDDDFIFCFAYALNCPGLEAYINEGGAKVIIQAFSSNAKLRRKYEFGVGEAAIFIRIKKDAIVKSVDFTAFIVAVRNDSFSLPEHNKEYYGDVIFSLRKGDLLAESRTVTINLDDTELQKPISSIFWITRNVDGCVYAVESNFNVDRIEIYLSPALYDSYDRLKRAHPSVRRNLSAAVMLPVLVEALGIMNSEGWADYSVYRWYASLKKSLDKHEIDLDTSDLGTTTIANMIFGDIMLDAMNSVESLLNSYDGAQDMEDVD